MEIIDIDQLPKNDDINYGCIAEDCSYSTDIDVKCGFCQKSLVDQCYQYKNNYYDYQYLCLKCHAKGVKLCHNDFRFYFDDELVCLNNNVNIHYSHNDIIEQFHNVANKRNFLEYYNIDIDGISEKMVNLKEE